MLTGTLTTLAVTAWTALWWRAGGGAIDLGPDKTDLARLLFKALPTASAALLVMCAWGMPWYIPVLCLFTTFGASCVGHSSEQVDTVEGYEGMTYVTLFTTTCVFVPFYLGLGLMRADFDVWRHFIFANFLFGVLGGFGDWLGYRMKGTLKFFGVTWCVPGDASWGELYRWGLTIGLPLGLMAAHA